MRLHRASAVRFSIVNCANLQCCSRCWLNEDRLNEKDFFFQSGRQCNHSESADFDALPSPSHFEHPLLFRDK